MNNLGVIIDNPLPSYRIFPILVNFFQKNGFTISNIDTILSTFNCYRIRNNSWYRLKIRVSILGVSGGSQIHINFNKSILDYLISIFLIQDNSELDTLVSALHEDLYYLS